MSTKGKIIKCRAAIAWEAKKPLSIEEIEVSPPKEGEVRIKICYSAICHTDIFALEGNNVNFPLILGHEGAGIVESIGSNVEGIIEGDYVIPAPLPQCRKCKICLNPNGNICEEFTFGNFRSEVMDDKTTRFTCKGKQIYHFIGLSTFSEYIVVRESAVCKINKKAPLDKVCLIGCGVTTGYGAPINCCVVTKGSIVGVWGMGAIGLSVVLGCKEQGADKISDAMECSKICTGQTCIIGVTNEKVKFNSIDLIFGRTIRGCVVGGYKTRDAMPMLVEKYLKGELPLEKFIDFRLTLDEINKGIENLKNSKGVRSIITIAGDNNNN